MSMDRFRTKKSLGQHFLSDKNVLSNIISAFPATSNDWVLEIGPGTGALTQYLWPRYPRLELVEVDAEAVAVLNERFEGVVIHQQDILKVNLRELIPSQLDVNGADSVREKWTMLEILSLGTCLIISPAQFYLDSWNIELD